jgi:hypothetical protein
MIKESLNALDEKLMALIQRRREEAGNPLPKTVELGSASDIARELGMSQGQADDA